MATIYLQNIRRNYLERPIERAEYLTPSSIPVATAVALGASGVIVEVGAETAFGFFDDASEAVPAGPVGGFTSGEGFPGRLTISRPGSPRGAKAFESFGKARAQSQSHDCASEAPKSRTQNSQ